MKSPEKQWEWLAYVDGKFIHREHAKSVPKIRECLRFLVRKYNKPVVYQIIKHSYLIWGTGQFSWETGVLATDLKWHRTSYHRDQNKKKPRTAPQGPNS